MKDFIEELTWRGMLQDMTPGTREQLQKEITSAYIGFDPTSIPFTSVTLPPSCY